MFSMDSYNLISNSGLDSRTNLLVEEVDDVILERNQEVLKESLCKPKLK